MKDKDPIQSSFFEALGELSTNFAKLEERVRLFVVILINHNEFSHGFKKIDKKSLSDVLKLLTKLTIEKAFYENEIKELVYKIIKYKKDRNLFIHGIWYRPNEIDGEVRIYVEEYKYDPVNNNFNEVFPHIRMAEYTLSQINETNQTIVKLSSDVLNWVFKYNDSVSNTALSNSKGNQ